MPPLIEKIKRVSKEISEWHGLVVGLTAIIAVAAGSIAAFWKQIDGEVPLNLRALVFAGVGILLCVSWLVWCSLKKEDEVARLRQAVAALDKEKAALLKPERRTTSGELVVDGILWSYTGDDDTEEWVRFDSLCPHCRTRLCVEDVTPLLALEPQDRRVRYCCDHPSCGKCNRKFTGTSADREEKAVRHILKEHEEKGPSKKLPVIGGLE